MIGCFGKQESNLTLLLIAHMRKAFSFLLPSSSVPEDFYQGVYITNLLTLLLSMLGFLLFYILFFLFGWSSTSLFIILTAGSFLFIILINRVQHKLGRVIFCLLPIYMTLFISVYGKYAEPNQTYITYFDSRFILLVTTILPAVSFRLQERVEIGVCLFSSFLCLMLYDPVHSLFNVGYFQLGFSASSYYYINAVTFICFLVLLFGVLTLKAITERAEHRAKESLHNLNVLNQELITRNEELVNLNHAKELHNEEMLRNQNELKASRELLAEANHLIREQQKKLQSYNLELEKKVEQKNMDLVNTNEELIRHNNELRQFSYTVSHNLRGPVARLLGLTDLFSNPLSHEDREEVRVMIKKSGHELDEVLKDLSLIIDIRNDLYKVRERILFETEWKKTISMLQDQIRPGYQVMADFTEAPFVYSIRAMVQSILYNLVSNAIKYRNPEKELLVEVKTSSLANEDIVLMVRDNGLGFNLDDQRENIFKLYKRFHTHVDGKGLGLYLVKTQVDTLGGKITIESQINRGTTFRITFPMPFDVSKQVFFDNDAAQIYYDANLNNTVISWKKNITGMEYRRAFQSVLHTLRTYHTPGWIADLRLQGVVPSEEQLWFLSTVLPEAVHCGLKRIAAIGFHDPVRKNYYDRMIAKTAEQGITLKVFESMEEAVLWMEGFIQRN